MSEATRLEQLVRRAFEAGELGALVLYAIGHDHARSPCARFTIDSPAPDGAWHDVYEQIEERALAQANALGGSHAFQCEWLRGQPLQVHEHEIFRVQAQAIPGQLVASEPANEGGLVAQLMRHNEAQQQSLIRSTQMALGSQAKIMETIANRADKIEQRYTDSLAAFLDAKWYAGEQEIERLKVEGNARAKQEIGRRLGEVLPLVLARAADHFGGDGAAGRMQAFVSSMSEQQLMQVAQHLRPEQQAQLFELIRPYIERSEKDAKGGVH